MADRFDIFINDANVTIDAQTTLAQAVAQIKAQLPYVLLVNNQIVPASLHTETMLNEHDRVDVISAIQGG